jgi:magnesium transporter
MPRFFKDRKLSRGLAPGSLVFIGDQKMEKPHITLLDYDKDQLTEELVVEVEALRKLKALPTVSWINIYGIHDPDIIQSLGDIFDIQPLLLEDILNTDQRPKFDEGEHNLGFILKIIRFDPQNLKIEADQVSIIFGENYVLTFQEQKANYFDSVRERIRNGKGRVRNSGSDYLVYVLLDVIIDEYLNVISTIGEDIENLGRKVLTNPDRKISSEFYKYKIEINFLRKNIRPVKEMILLWVKSDTLLVNKKTKAFLQDLSDLITQAEESIEIYNNLLADGLNIHDTNMSQKANEIMKVLTIFAALFIPLTFLAGIYGMNFKYFPELGFRYSYPIFWGVVLLIGGGLFLFFRKKKWI